MLCRNCGHRRDWHSRPGFCAGDVLTPQGDDRNNCPCKIFWPAYLSMAGPIDLRSLPAAGETAGDAPDREGASCQKCGHAGAWHPFANAEKCVKDNCFCEGYTLMEPETAGEPEQCNCDCHTCDDSPCDDCTGAEAPPEPEASEDESRGVPDCGWNPISASPYCDWDPECPQHGPHPYGAAVAPEPEAPEEPPCPSCGSQNGTWFDRSVCAEPCGSMHDRCSNCGAVTGDACLNETPQAPPRRPPYAVAYELEDGTAYEVALPGDASVGSFNGALIITHTSSPVKGLTHARPMEGQ